VIRGGWRLDFPDLGAETLFAIAADIESYPQFLPWCRRARITAREANRLVVDNLFGLGPIEAGFESHAELDPPQGLVITSDDGPFKQFRLEWRFEPLSAGGTRASAAYEMALRASLLEPFARLSLAEVDQRVIRAFKQRVRAVRPSPGGTSPPPSPAGGRG
jgi:coenzyme Q-binding protein COQ10